MKKNYECPILSVLRFHVEDTLTTGGENGNNLPVGMSTVDEVEEW